MTARAAPTGWNLTLWIAAGLLTLTTVVLLDGGFDAESVRLLVRTSARTSVCLFAVVFAASSLVRLRPAPATRWLLRNRRYLGVGFAVSHFLHLAAVGLLLAGFPQAVEEPPDPRTLIGGGITTAVIAAMALTSSDRAQARMGMRGWRRLHRVGSYFVWLIFAQTYLPAAASEPLAAPFAALLVGSLGLRILSRLRLARRAHATAGAALLGLGLGLGPVAGSVAEATQSGVEALEEQLRIRGLEAHLFNVGTRSLHISISAGGDLDDAARSGLCEAVTSLAGDLVPERSVTIELHFDHRRRSDRRCSCRRPGSKHPPGAGTC